MESRLRTCPFCKQPFEVRSNSQVFCSVKCRNKNLWCNNSRYEPGKIQCLICKLWYRQVGSHIVQTHGITAREYRQEYGFDVKRGQLSEELRELKSKQVFENGTIENLKLGKKYRLKKGQVLHYKRSKQTMERLREQGKKIGNKYVDKALASRGIKRREVTL